MTSRAVGTAGSTRANQLELPLSGQHIRSTLSPRLLSARLDEPFPPTAEQVAAISAPPRPHVVVAGAGSGKTHTMALRVVWLVANGLVEPHRVLGLTFTRKAAAELGERVRRMLRRLHAAHQRDPFLPAAVARGLGAGEPTVSTYHSYAAGLVAEHALRVGLEPDARLIGEAVSWQFAAEVVESYDGPMDAVERAATTVIGDVLSLAAELAEHLRTPDEVRTFTDDLQARLASLPRAADQRGAAPPRALAELSACLEARLALLPMVERYSALKRARGAMDYGDQVAVAARIAQEHAQVGDVERSRFGAVLLDEYQDTGEAQRLLLTSLYGGGHPVTAVGDPRQSIYGWRGASAGNLERFLADFCGSSPFGSGDNAPMQVSGLSVSFRNGERILAVANRVASPICVRGLPAPTLQPGPGRESTGVVLCALHETVVDEASWVADQISRLGRRAADPTPWREIVVLARKRSHFARIEAALHDQGVPCEIVGLGGLLQQPEVVDIVSILRVLGDPTAGNAAVRVLTGPRWRIGAADLAALGRRARRLAVATGGSVAAGDVDPEYDVVDERSLIDALDEPGPSGQYSSEGYRRLTALRDELRSLRRWTAQPLPELVAAVARTLCLDIELAARPGVLAGDALLNVDRLLEVAEEFVAAGDDPGLLAFLAYLDAAEERERGLETEVADGDGDRVRLMTVHAAKGLEWEAVFVAGLTRCVFPVEGQPVADWTRQLFALPFPLRGDRDELPRLQEAALDQSEAKAATDRFRAACKARAALEERRLAYVAVTRAKGVLGCSGYWWDTTTKPRGPSDLLTEIKAECDDMGLAVEVWCPEPLDDATNPLDADSPEMSWPTDPLAARRRAVEAGAAMVYRAARLARGKLPSGEAQTEHAEVLAAWQQEADLLLTELATDGTEKPSGVELPHHLSVSELVQLRRDPGELARQIRRPLPRAPAPRARRGTRFHLWLEQRWGQQRLIDIDELPGAADESAEHDADLLALQAAFLAGEWAARVPAEIEFPFDVLVDGVVLRGRVDAVFTDDPDGFVDVVDWKTGKVPPREDAAAAAVQLAVYRLAWHHVSGTPLDRIRASFHYVGVNRTIAPADLLGPGELQALLRSVPFG